jgi:hypothetical protein
MDTGKTAEEEITEERDYIDPKISTKKKSSLSVRIMKDISHKSKH